MITRLPALLYLLALLLFPVSLCAAQQRAGLIANPGFELVKKGLVAGWEPFGKGYTVDSAAHSGANSIHCANTTDTETHGAQVTVWLNQKTPTPLIVTGWSKARNVSGTTNGDYAIYADLECMDGTPIWGEVARFAVGTHDWQRRVLRIYPSKPVKFARIFALFRNHSGDVWFDDFTASELTGSGLFDSQPVAPPKLPANARSGWFARDVAANSPVLLLQAEDGTIGDGAVKLGLRLTGLHSDAQGQIVNGMLADTTGKPRAVTVYYVERFDAPQAVWWNELRESLPVGTTGERANQVRINAGATGAMSLYPFGCVTGQGKGRTVGVPPALGPRIARIGYHASAKLLYVACDLGLTGQNRANSDGKGHGRAPIGVARYDVPPEWGFRAAAEGFYKLFPEAYKRYATAEGIWIPFTDPSKLSNPQDFHIAYHEGDNSLASDDKLGILSFRYTEPMTYWMVMPPKVPRTYENAIEQLQKEALGTDAEKKKWAQAVLNSGSYDENGRFNVEFQNAPWANGAVWTLNPNPRLPHKEDEWTKARLNYSIEMADKAYGPDAKGVQDGEYLDSIEGWADNLDYRPESLRASQMPPTFSTDNYRPVLPTWFSVYEEAAFMRADLHRRGKLLMANSTPWRITAFAPLLDVMGTEINWLSADGKFSPDSDSFFGLRRIVCYHKPYLLLQNTNFDKFDAAMVEKYFRRCLFYGVYPSMFSVDAATHPYWEEPRWYNRDRSLFQKYIPIVQKLSAAGWEPLTYARSENAKVHVERYGSDYLTVLNTSAEASQTNLTVELDRFAKFPAGTSLQVTDEITGDVLATVPATPTVRLSLSLKSEQVCALHLNATQ